jgi:hypothetical protein
VRFAALALLLVLAACQQDPPSQGARDDSTPPLTVEGYGPVTIGMTLEEARAASAAPLNEGGGITDEDAQYCQEQPWTVADGDKLYLMFEEGRLTRITADSDASHVRTAQNVGVGSTDAEVRTAYQGVVESPAKYNDPPAHDLTAWTTPDQAGLRFEINEAGVVTQVHAGGAAIQYVEGCA